MRAAAPYARLVARVERGAGAAAGCCKAAQRFLRRWRCVCTPLALAHEAGGEGRLFVFLFAASTWRNGAGRTHSACAGCFASAPWTPAAAGHWWRRKEGVSSGVLRALAAAFSNHRVPGARRATYSKYEMVSCSPLETSAVVRTSSRTCDAWMAYRVVNTGAKRGLKAGPRHGQGPPTIDVALSSSSSSSPAAAARTQQLGRQLQRWPASV